jgi:hypothetical protein
MQVLVMLLLSACVAVVLLLLDPDRACGVVHCNKLQHVHLLLSLPFEYKPTMAHFV